MFTSHQLRGARAFMKWSIQDLSNRTGIGTTTLKRFEASEGMPNGYLRNFETLKRLFESEGIEFIGTPEEGAGVRWKKGFPK